MPVTKIQINHNFGIISHSQRVKLQERLLRQSYVEFATSDQATQRSKQPLEVSEDFVDRFNDATSLDGREKYDNQARKLIERIKRRAGILTDGVGNHVNIPLAWSEMAQLAQCRGRIQESCLDALIISLDQARFADANIASLFYLAESMLYWLRNDVIRYPYMRISEMKLLKMGYLVFLRLYFHHMTGKLQNKRDNKTRLFSYLEGLNECQEAYSPYPISLLCLRFIIEVGKIIVSDIHSQAREAIDGDKNREADELDVKFLSDEAPSTSRDRVVVMGRSKISHRILGDDITFVDTDGKILSGKPSCDSSDINLNVRTYNKDSNVVTSRNIARLSKDLKGIEEVLNESGSERTGYSRNVGRHGEVGQSAKLSNDGVFKYGEGGQTQKMTKSGAVKSGKRDKFGNLGDESSELFKEVANVDDLLKVNIVETQKNKATLEKVDIRNISEKKGRQSGNMRSTKSGKPQNVNASNANEMQLDDKAGLSRESTGNSVKSSQINSNNNTPKSPRTGTLSACVHDLSPSLWHALDVWRCTNHLGGGHSAAVKSLLQCGVGISSENWVDTITAMYILAESAKNSLQVLDVLQDLACGVIPPPPRLAQTATNSTYLSNDYNYNHSSGETNTKVTTTPKRDSLSDICEESQPSSANRSGTVKMELNRADLNKSQNAIRSVNKEQPQKSTPPRSDYSPNPVNPQHPTYAYNTRPPSRNATHPQNEIRPPTVNEPLSASSIDTFGDELLLRKGDYCSSPSITTLVQQETDSWKEGDAPPNTSWYVKIGSEFVCRRATDDCSVITFTNLNKSKGVLGLNGWHWEVSVTYAEMLASICLCSNQSQVQKRALLGRHNSVSDCLAQKRGTLPLYSSGLIDLAFFEPAIIPENEAISKSDVWSWRIRYGAVKSLVLIYKTFIDDPVRDGLRNAAWQALQRAQRIETNQDVLEALKVGEIRTKIVSPNSEAAVTIGSKISEGLAAIYLPPLPPPVDRFVPTKPHKSPNITQLTYGKFKPQLRTSLKDEVDLASVLYQRLPDYFTRTSFDLRRVVEDQWRKELQERLDEEEKERMNELRHARVIEEEIQVQRNAVRDSKFMANLVDVKSC